ncbi:hypothetical protein PVAP13_6KG254606 [Panicum virgatum]|uniref:Uncharacterized protein n=1 Tax=Panicum virgatum TaxID=38727 RepID=A0A8T0REV9_PANVG|nr:hypothetical protein PVAP13_6KG254606 [Panicum virgatum]
MAPSAASRCEQNPTLRTAGHRQLLHRTTSPAPSPPRRVPLRMTPAPARCARRGRPRRGRTRQHASATRTAHGPGVRRGIKVSTSSGGEPAKVQPGSLPTGPGRMRAHTFFNSFHIRHAQHLNNPFESLVS